MRKLSRGRFRGFIAISVIVALILLSLQSSGIFAIVFPPSASPAPHGNDQISVVSQSTNATDFLLSTGQLRAVQNQNLDSFYNFAVLIPHKLMNVQGYHSGPFMVPIQIMGWLEVSPKGPVASNHGGMQYESGGISYSNNYLSWVDSVDYSVNRTFTGSHTGQFYVMNFNIGKGAIWILKNGSEKNNTLNVTVTASFGVLTSNHPSFLSAVKSLLRVYVNTTFHLTYTPLTNNLFGPWKITGKYSLSHTGSNSYGNVTSITKGKQRVFET